MCQFEWVLIDTPTLIVSFVCLFVYNLSRVVGVIVVAAVAAVVVVVIAVAAVVAVAAVAAAMTHLNDPVVTENDEPGKC